MPTPLTEPLPPDAAFGRYSSRPFPPYHFVPTLNPHPCAHPQGHSYEPPGTPPHRAPLPPPEQWNQCDEYLFGADLYNYAYWWEAHETWESIWQSSDKASPQGRFLQGLIQISAAHLKRHVGSTDGMSRLLERSRIHLDFVQARVPLHYMGLSLPPFRATVESYFAGAAQPYPFVWLNSEPATSPL